MCMTSEGRPAVTGEIQGGSSASGEALFVVFHDTKRMRSLSVLPFLKAKTSKLWY